MADHRISAPGALAALGALGVGAAVWGMGVERYLFTLRTATLPILPTGSAPLRVLHLSDIHMAPWQRRKQAWIAGLAQLEPDLVINTGDNLGHEDGLRGVRAAFAGLKGVPGFFVHGSNDLNAPSPRNPFRYFLGPSKRHLSVTRLDSQAMDRFFTESLGWKDLNNATASIEVGGRRIDGFGVSDAHQQLDRLEDMPALVDEQRKDGDAVATLAVTHAPYRRVLDAFTDLGADAIFAGHTHGGQVRVPGVGALVANCDIPLSQSRGLSAWTHADRRIPLHVSAGLGHSIYAPVRFACFPEASLLTLTAREGAIAS